MRPLLSLVIRTDIAPALDPEQIADMINFAMDREFTGGVVNVRVLRTVEDLQAYESGQMVMYRKPARKVGNKIVYERDGVRHELEQETLFGG